MNTEDIQRIALELRDTAIVIESADKYIASRLPDAPRLLRDASALIELLYAEVARLSAHNHSLRRNAVLFRIPPR